MCHKAKKNWEKLICMFSIFCENHSYYYLIWSTLVQHFGQIIFHDTLVTLDIIPFSTRVGFQKGQFNRKVTFLVKFKCMTLVKVMKKISILLFKKEFFQNHGLAKTVYFLSSQRFRWIRSCMAHPSHWWSQVEGNFSMAQPQTIKLITVNFPLNFLADFFTLSNTVYKYGQVIT